MQEYLRLKKLLSAAEAKSSLEADEALLAGGALDDSWRLRTIVQFRRERKRALHHITQKLAKMLAIHFEDEQGLLAEQAAAGDEEEAALEDDLGDDVDEVQLGDEEEEEEGLHDEL